MDNFTFKTNDKVIVEDMLIELIPGFLKNKRDDLDTIDQMLAQNEYDKIKKIGHNWKGACPSYGFNYLGEVGQQFEILVEKKDYDSLKNLVKTLPNYLENVVVERGPSAFQ
jgi:HPt (histidine-containing phosphotransfer) domain-containing protein